MVEATRSIPLLLSNQTLALFYVPAHRRKSQSHIPYGGVERTLTNGVLYALFCGLTLEKQQQQTHVTDAGSSAHGASNKQKTIAFPTQGAPSTP